MWHSPTPFFFSLLSLESVFSYAKTHLFKSCSSGVTWYIFLNRKPTQVQNSKPSKQLLTHPHSSTSTETWAGTLTNPRAVLDTDIPQKGQCPCYWAVGSPWPPSVWVLPGGSGQRCLVQRGSRRARPTRAPAEPSRLMAQTASRVSSNETPPSVILEVFYLAFIRLFS